MVFIKYKHVFKSSVDGIMGAGKINVHRQIANLDYIVTNVVGSQSFVSTTIRKNECVGGKGIWKELYGIWGGQ